LLEQHPGKVVLFKGGEVQGIYETYDEAYAAGVDKFGVDTEFLIELLLERHAPSVSLSWLHGLIHVQT
jgi:hypothetical protein